LKPVNSEKGGKFEVNMMDKEALEKEEKIGVSSENLL
jgi:hypothetical protein